MDYHTISQNSLSVSDYIASGIVTVHFSLVVITINSLAIKYHGEVRFVT